MDKKNNLNVRYTKWDKPELFVACIHLHDVLFQLYRMILQLSCIGDNNDKLLHVPINQYIIEKAIKRAVFNDVKRVIGDIPESDLLAIRDAMVSQNYLEKNGEEVIPTETGRDKYHMMLSEKEKTDNDKTDNDKTDIFISYSHKDKNLLDELKVFLSVIERKKYITYWDDSQIKPGKQWRKEIEKILARAKIAILLVSPDFLASDFIMDEELPYIIEAAENEKMQIAWIPLSHSLFKETPISDYQALYDPTSAIDNYNKPQRNKAYRIVCEQLMSML